NGYDDKPHSIAVDHHGFVAVVGEGYVAEAESRLDSITVTYDPGGASHGTSRTALPGKGLDRAEAAAYKPHSPDLYVTGESNGKDIWQAVTTFHGPGSKVIWQNGFR